MPDLERLVAAIHLAGVKVTDDHPESRAIYYENTMYNSNSRFLRRIILQNFTEHPIF